jgi:hypothetical protein
MLEKEDQRNEYSEIHELRTNQSPYENYLTIEHLQKMPNIFSRGLLYLIGLIVLIGLGYSLISKVDIVVKGKSIVRPMSPKINILSPK